MARVGSIPTSGTSKVSALLFCSVVVVVVVSLSQHQTADAAPQIQAQTRTNEAPVARRPVAEKLDDGQGKAQVSNYHVNHVVAHSTDRTANLSLLINETLTINNKTVASDSERPLVKDDWTFDMVEYDLIEFLQDLSARYRLANGNKSLLSEEPNLGASSQLAAKTVVEASSEAKFGGDRVEVPKKASTLSEPLDKLSPPPAESGAASTGPAQLPVSLASGDQEVAESGWQYGIFDRFTRPRSTSTTPKPDPLVGSSSQVSYDLRTINSDECGLRSYEEESQYFPQPFEEEATKELNQRRQRPPPASSFFSSHKKSHSSSSVLADDGLEDELDRIRRPPLDSFGNQRDPLDKTGELGASHGVGNESPADSEFNLSLRRQWLQQQLGNTLQMLGFNVSSQSPPEFLNQTSGLSLNLRENMMKQSNKVVGRSLEGQGPVGSEQAEISEQELRARQDELKLEARVIGGSDARLGDSPWSASLQALVSRPGTGGVEYRHYCGGTIISEYYILTAAHCLDFMVGRESRLFVVIGDLNWRMSAASLHGRRFGIEKLIIHSGYKSTAFGHDIGLIRTKESMRPVKVNGRYIINSVCLPERAVEHSGEAELVGWGLFSNRNEMADSLQIADVPILPRPLCVELYRRRTGLIQWLIGIELITEKQICAGTFGRGICQGDSGSALVFNEKISRPPSARGPEGAGSRRSREQQNRATIIGIVAFGGIRRCSYQSLPGVYMQTSKYMDWILPRITPPTSSK